MNDIKQIILRGSFNIMTHYHEVRVTCPVDDVITDVTNVPVGCAILISKSGLL